MKLKTTVHRLWQTGALHLLNQLKISYTDRSKTVFLILNQHVTKYKSVNAV